MNVFIVTEELRYEETGARVVAVKSSYEMAIDFIIESMKQVYASWRYSQFTIEEWTVDGKSYIELTKKKIKSAAKLMQRFFISYTLTIQQLSRCIIKYNNE